MGKLVSMVKVGNIELWAKVNDEDTQSCIRDVMSDVVYSDFVKDGTIVASTFIEPIPVENTCTHRDKDNKLTIEYDSSYEMRSSDMHCTQCEIMGSREEFDSEKI